MGIAQRASVAALKFGVVLQRPTFGQCFFLPAFVVKSFSTAQPTFDLNSFSERNRIIVPVQLFATKFAAIRVNLCWLLHFGDSGVGNVIEAIEGGTRGERSFFVNSGRGQSWRISCEDSKRKISYRCHASPKLYVLYVV